MKTEEKPFSILDKDAQLWRIMWILFIGVLACAYLSGCVIKYSTDGKTRSIETGFTPTESDWKAIKELR